MVFRTEDLTEKQIKLQVADAPPGDVGRGIVRMDPQDMERLLISIGDVVSLAGRRQTYAKVMRTYTTDRGKGIAQLDEILRANARAAAGETITIKKVPFVSGKRVALSVMGSLGSVADQYTEELSRHLQSMAVAVGDKVRLERRDLAPLDFAVEETSPQGPVVVGVETELAVVAPTMKADGEQKVTFANIGGLSEEIQKIREVVELPLKYPEIFQRLGIEAPRGVLLYGPPGCGKTLMARAVAGETSARFFHISGPEIFHKFYGESEAHLREIFKEAVENAPSIIFLDEIDAIAAKREDVYGEVEKRVVAQLMALMDGLESRGQVIVIAATNIPGALDQALRRPGRFDREISMPIPNEAGRIEILKIHTKTMPLSPEVDLKEIAQITYGYVGADLENLCREAGMITLRKALPTIDFSQQHVPEERLKELVVTKQNFLEALKGIKPSAIREIFSDVAKVKWEDIGGLKEAKQTLQEAIEWPMKYARLFEHAHAKPARGVLLYGPSGTGKTMLAKAVASESGTNFITVQGPALLSKWVGDSEKAVRDIFKKARMTAPSIIFLDELDALAPARGSGGDSNVTERVVSQILTEMDGIEELQGVVVLAATNRIDMVDPSLLASGRFELIVPLPLPTRDERLEVFKIHTKDKPLADDVDLDILSDLTEGFSGGDIASVCRRATTQAIREYVDTHSGKDLPEDLSKFQIAARHFRKAMDEARSTGKGAVPDKHDHAQQPAAEAATSSPTASDGEQAAVGKRPGRKGKKQAPGGA